MTQKVLFVGLDGADWAMLDPLLAKGAMPNLARLVAGGASGVLEAEPPLLSPIVWTTMMTGRSPLDHRVLDFTRFDPASGARVPMGSDERRVPAVWSVASEAGKSVAVFGVWATHPAEAVNGIVVSDRFLSAEEPVAGSVSPAASVAWAEAAKRKARTGMTLARLRAIVPDATPAELETAAASHGRWNDPLFGAFQLLARTETMRELAVERLAAEPWDLAIVYFEGSDTVGHLFARYAPPRMAGVDAALFERFSGLPERYFARLDAILGELAAIAERAGATLLVASDHGFEWGEGRPATSSSSDMTASTWHRPEGIYLLCGEGVAPTSGHSGRGGSASIAASILALAGVPHGTRMAPPLAEVRAAGAPVDLPDGPPSSPGVVAGAAANEASAREELARLAALGYLGSAEAKSASREKTDRPHGARTAASLSNEAAILERAGRGGEAARLYAAAVEQEPESAPAKWNLSNFLFEQDREPARSDELLAEALAGGLAEGERLLAGRARALAGSGAEARARRLLDRGLELRPDSVGLRLSRGQLRVSAGDCRDGAADFERLTRLEPDLAAAWGALGMARLCLGDGGGANAALRRALWLDPGRGEFAAALALLEAN